MLANIIYEASKCVLEIFVATSTKYHKMVIAMLNTYILGRLSSLAVIFTIEDAMRLFLEIAFLLLPLLVIGQDKVALKFLFLASC